MSYKHDIFYQQLTVLSPFYQQFDKQLICFLKKIFAFSSPKSALQADPKIRPFQPLFCPLQRGRKKSLFFDFFFKNPLTVIPLGIYWYQFQRTKRPKNMTAITIAAKAQAIAATALFVNTKEPRSQLAGVAFQRKNDQLRLVGTDGTALFAITLPAVELPYDFSDVTITFTADQLRAFSKKSNRDQDVTLRIDTVANLAEVCFDSTSSIATIIDHKYPDVDRIIDADRTPAPGDDTPPAFQTKYLITFDKVAKLLGGDASMRIHAKGELNAVAVRFPAHPDVQAVIMPVHVKDQ